MARLKTDRRTLIRMAAAGSMALAPSSLFAQQRGASEGVAPRSPQSANWSEPLSRYIANSQTAKIDDETRELAKRHLLDTLASIVACRSLQPAVLGREFSLKQSGRESAAPILGTKQRCSLLDAIFASAMCAHAAEINDFCPSAFVQPGASVVPAALCVGDARKVSGEALLRAVIVGYEIACRLPKALGVANLNAAVLANHSVGPLFGVAAALASLLKLPADRLDHVYSYCVQQASGSWQWLRDIEHVEKAFTFAGMPARRGAESVFLVEQGFTGIGDPFKGDPGWLNSIVFTREGSDFNPAYLVERLGERSEFPLIAYKRYPVGGPTQPVIELMLSLVKRHPPASIRKVRIEMPGRAAAFASAQMPALNLPYLCSIIILDGKLDFVAAQSRERFLNDQTVRAFMPNVEVVHDPAQEAKPRVESARVKLTLADGTQTTDFLHHVKGFPEHPFDRADVEAKALELMAPEVGNEAAKRLIRLTTEIEAIGNVRELTSLLATRAR